MPSTPSALAVSAWFTTSLLGVLAVAGLFYGLFALSDGAWIGGGDVKLAVGMGVLLGLEVRTSSYFYSGVYWQYLRASRHSLLRQKSVLPRYLFGPFLIMATIVSFLFGKSLIGWYMNLIIF